MAPIHQTGRVNKVLKANNILKFFQRVYSLTLWAIAAFESGRAVLPKMNARFDPTDERRFPPTQGAVDFMEAKPSAVERPTAPSAALGAAHDERVGAVAVRACSRQTQFEGPPSGRPGRAHEAARRAPPFAFACTRSRKRATSIAAR